MTYTDPGSPNGAGKGDGEDAVPLPDEGGPRQDTSSGSAGGAASEPHSAGGSGAGGTSETGTGGGAADSGEFLGVEKDFWLRLLYCIAAGFVAWVSFWFIIILAVAQIIYRLAAGHVNKDLRGFTRNMIRYVWDLLGFVTLVRDDRPFLFGGKFPDSEADPT